MIGSKIIETQDGLYAAPINLRFELALIALLAVAAIVRQAAPIVLVIWSSVLLLAVFVRYRQFKRHGPMGRPSVAVANGTLYIDRPGHSEGGVGIQTEELQRIVIYGQTRRRIVRLVKRDKSFVDITPRWGTVLEQRAIAFLVKALPALTTVEEPQSMFASVRGDDPQTDA